MHLAAKRSEIGEFRVRVCSFGLALRVSGFYGFGILQYGLVANEGFFLCQPKDFEPLSRVPM